MKFFKKAFCVLIGFCLLVGLTTCLVGCKEEDIHLYINAPETLIVEVNEKVQVPYSVNPTDCLVTFKRIGENIFDFEKSDGKYYIKGISVGSAVLHLSGVYKQKSAFADIQIIVSAQNAGGNTNPSDDKNENLEDGKEKPDISPDVNPDNSKDDDNGMNEEIKQPIEAGNRVLIEYEDVNGGYFDEGKIIVKSGINLFVLYLSSEIEKGEFRVYKKIDNVLTLLSPTGLGEYRLPVSCGNYVLAIEVEDLDKDIKYIKNLEVVVEID